MIRKIIISLNVYKNHLFITYLDGSIDIVKFQNFNYGFNKFSNLSYSDKIENNELLNDVQPLQDNLIVLKNSKIFKINLQSNNQESLFKEKIFTQLWNNTESKRLDILTTGNKINSISYGANINQSRLIDRKIKISEKHIVSHMKSHKNNVFLSVRGYGVEELTPWKKNSYRTQDAQDLELSKKHNIIAVADGMEGIVIFETDNKKPIKKITIGDEVCQEISTFQNMLIIKCKNGLFIYNLSSNKLTNIWNKSVGTYTTFNDMIFLSSENNIYMIPYTTASEKHFRLYNDSIKINIENKLDKLK